MKIYTRTGDKGTTSLFSGQRVPKNHPFVEALGAVDEANSALGTAVSFLSGEPSLSELKTQLETIQHALFDAGAAIATPRTCHQNKKLEKTRFDPEEVTNIEKKIDAMEAELPELTSFILPGGHPAGAALHLARSMVRRAERLVVPLYEQSDVDISVLVYLNRLSDYLFVASRFVNSRMKIPETAWSPHQTSIK